ncbi:DUF2288 family protein [Marinobacter halodurans]|uniref:DUF2288 family protein n=1 Tax=Marinobacter halodurans TaxID=2528979 RepID=A0ABY1ZJY1_9GAMM|nr:DUF2288 family protein [Marinobacter halodurans]TBW55475.1 DUF2288 family protein [Marinobacter halodurans]
MAAEQSTDNLRDRLNLETARIPWRDLQTYFARGQVVFVAEALDLLAVAEALAADDKARFQQWLADGQVGEVPAERAQSWYDAEASVWAVVVAPWVLIQDGKTKN